MERKLIALGTRFGKRVVVGRAPNGVNGGTVYHVRCDCGRNDRVLAAYLRSTTACRRCAHAKWQTGSRGEHVLAFQLWGRLRRGKSLSPVWARDFDAFFKTVGDPRGRTLLPKRPGLIGPSNWRWARHRTRRDGMVEFQGEYLTLAEWAEELGISRQLLNQRIHVLKWPLSRALTEGKNK